MLVSESEKNALESIGTAFESVKKQNSVQYILLQSYIKNYENILKNSNLIVAPEGK